jgi:hypothetical protein
MNETTKATETKNDTFWPDELVSRNHGALGWTPLAKVLVAEWHRFKLKSECFATLIWLLSWVRGTNYKNVRYSQAAIARQQGVHRHTINRHMKKMEGKFFTYVADGRISFELLMEKLALLEHDRQYRERDAALTRRLGWVGLHERSAGRPRHPEVPPAEARFGAPNYDTLYEEEGLEFPALADSSDSSRNVSFNAPQTSAEPQANEQASRAPMVVESPSLDEEAFLDQFRN